MEIDDAALMYQGWIEQLNFDLEWLRATTFLIAEVVNKSAGGKGVMKNMKKMMPLPGDNAEQTRNLVDMLKKHNESGLKKGLKNVKGAPLTINVRLNEEPNVPVKKIKQNGKRRT